MQFSLNFARAHGDVHSSAKFRSRLEDFIVEEQFDFEEDLQGEHIYLHLKKRGQNTQWIADQLADFCGVSRMDVGFCGLKDRHGVTSQWFSIYAPQLELPDWQPFVERVGVANVEILHACRGSKKLRRGMHACNKFEIWLRDLDLDKSILDEKLKKIKSLGVPNYFGEQRFGNSGNNLLRAEQWVTQTRKPQSSNNKSRGHKSNHRSKKKKPNMMVVSAARSYMFNLVLSARVANDSWRDVLDGEVLTEIGQITGPMWGRGRPLSQDAVAELEAQALNGWEQWLESLEYCGFSQERRALLLSPSNFEWSFEDRVLSLSFSLPPGEYATSVLREIALLENCSGQKISE